MPVRTVTLTAEAYKALAASKEEGESFSSVVRRLTGTQVRLSEFAGAWKDAPRSQVGAFRRYVTRADVLSARDLKALVSRVSGRKRGESR